jgi:hypothetical protein
VIAAIAAEGCGSLAWAMTNGVASSKTRATFAAFSSGEARLSAWQRLVIGATEAIGATVASSPAVSAERGAPCGLPTSTTVYAIVKTANVATDVMAAGAIALGSRLTCHPRRNKPRVELAAKRIPAEMQRQAPAAIIGEGALSSGRAERMPRRIKMLRRTQSADEVERAIACADETRSDEKTRFQVETRLATCSVRTMRPATPSARAAQSGAAIAVVTTALDLAASDATARNFPVREFQMPIAA